MASKKTLFQEAFAKARREQGADGVFTFKGKEYNTRRADDPPKGRGGRTPRQTLDRPERPTKVRPKGQPEPTGVGGLRAKTIEREGKVAARRQDDRVASNRGAARPMSAPKIEAGERSRDKARADKRDEFTAKLGVSDTGGGAKPRGFREAFAKARREQGADGVFTFEGKKYNTRRADDLGKPAKKNMGGVIKYAHGGKVRGYGKARGGRACKMVSMKGS